MGIYLNPDDLPKMSTEDAEEAIRDAEALAILEAPCLENPDPPLTEIQFHAVQAILKAAILRWNEVGTGVATQVAAGPYSMTSTPQARPNAFWPSEVRRLKGICSGSKGRQAFGYSPRLGRR